jgi:hypothetical protein
MTSKGSIDNTSNLNHIFKLRLDGAILSALVRIR